MFGRKKEQILEQWMVTVDEAENVQSSVYSDSDATIVLSQLLMFVLR